MERSIFRYIWRHSRRDQIIICAVVLASLPFYFASLDLPRRIVNEAIQGKAFEHGHAQATFLKLSIAWPAWLGGGTTELFGGVQVDRFGLLFGLSTLFLFFVLVNGAFKYWINVQKGVLGERMLRRLRFELFSLVLRFTPDAFRQVKPAETATIIKDEVEPIGSFIGDAFILPAFLGTQAATALIFIMLQNMWLGFMALAVVGVQIVVIPRMRRALLRLGRQRQLASRRLAGRVGEVVDGMEAIHVHDAGRWERAEIGQRLYELFDVRMQIYKRKFVVKFLNNFLAQLTPFFFYCIGGYFALKGRLDIGQLVAVIAAYRDLPPPLKELIDWDQQRLDVQVKYDQVVQQFSPERLLPEPSSGDDAHDISFTGPLVAENVRVVDAYGVVILDAASFSCRLPARIAIVSDGGPGAGLVARLFGRRVDQYDGTIRIGDRDLADVPTAALGRQVAYAGLDPILFPGSLRDNIVFGLRHRPLRRALEDSAAAARRVQEALRTGNPTDAISDEWVDYERAGVRDEDELDRKILELLARVGLEDDIYRFGLSGRVTPKKHPALAERLIEARTRLRRRLEEAGAAGLVDPFDPTRYNRQATVAENLLFGVPMSADLVGTALANHPAFRQALAREGLVPDLVAMGIRIAETMTEIFRGLPPGHMLFEQFSFVSAEELPLYEDILRRVAPRGRRPRRRDRTRLLALPLAYVEPRHRLGLLNEALQDKIVAARPRVRAALENLPEAGVEFFDPERVSATAPLRDNLLFGRIDTSVANAQAAVTDAMSAVIAEMGLRPDVERVGLDHQVGPSGRNLNGAQRAGVNLVRCLVKRPDLLIVDGALAPFGEVRARALTALLVEMSQDRTLAMALPNDREIGPFDTVLRIQNKAVLVDAPRPRTAQEPLAQEPLAQEPLAQEPLAQEPLSQQPLAAREPDRGRRLAGVAS